MTYDYLFAKAKNLYETGALNEAEQTFRQILILMPEHPDALNMLGLIAQQKNQHKSAKDFFYQAVIHATEKHIIYFNLAISLTALNELDEAIYTYQKVLSFAPNIKEAYNNLGAIYEQKGDLEQAIKNYQKALEIDPNYPEAEVNLAALKHDTEALKKLIQKYPFSPLPLYYLARELFVNGESKSALPLIEKAQTFDNSNCEISLLKGKINFSLENKEEARTDFHRAVQSNPSCLEALLWLGVLEKQESFYKKALDLDPHNFEAHAAYADFLYAEGRIVEALEEYRQAMIINPQAANISNNLGLILKDMGEYEQALDLFFNAFVQSPEIEEISQNIAQTLLLLHKNDPKRAVEIAKRWTATAPENIWATQTVDAFEGRSSKDEHIYHEKLFDAFAETYDQTMQKLKYGIFDAIKKNIGSLKGNILDLGCGTGLAAEALKNDQNTFTGVDISQNMLEIARSKNIYTKLIHSDMSDFLKKEKQNYDYILATDVFNYVQDIEGLLEEISAPCPIIFSIENAAPEIKSFERIQNGRYQHNPKFIRELLTQKGWKNINAYPLIIRYEDNEPVQGTLFEAH